IRDTKGGICERASRIQVSPVLGQGQYVVWQAVPKGRPTGAVPARYVGGVDPAGLREGAPHIQIGAVIFDGRHARVDSARNSGPKRLPARAIPACNAIDLHAPVRRERSANENVGAEDLDGLDDAIRIASRQRRPIGPVPAGDVARAGVVHVGEPTARIQIGSVAGQSKNVGNVESAADAVVEPKPIGPIVTGDKVGLGVARGGEDSARINLPADYSNGIRLVAGAYGPELAVPMFVPGQGSEQAGATRPKSEGRQEESREESVHRTPGSPWRAPSLPARRK